ncbi:hypothetical protein [Klebsiella variicola]|uniref:hypothetical protein n=1 Tax=Klebsiella variicola TaxID=244366 RepID=UPI001F1DAE7E|nr:hypothetical protein [Klebsiella variicola]
MQLEILPTIDHAKSYPRGTFAAFNGGLWRAFQQTDEKHGWECVVDGLANFEVEQSDDLRTISVKAYSAAGKVNKKSFVMPVMIYREVYVSEKTYEPGDCVTWAGSLWHCNEQTQDKPGEPLSKGWKLAVKRGRDGK